MSIQSARYTSCLTVSPQRSNTLEQILDVLRESTIAEERGEDVESKFLASYKKVSNDMGIILTFVCSFLRLSMQV